MSKEDGQKLAIDRALAELQAIDIHARCQLHGFTIEDGMINLRVFGQDVSLDTDTFSATSEGKPLKPGDTILLLHYLLTDLPITETGEQITFRDLTGGQFYWGPFQSRTVKPLVAKIGNDLELLKKNLTKFDWEAVSLGDFAAKIHCLGNLYITLIWHLGDDEFPASADLIFDGCIKRVFEAEDAAVMASRICIGCLF